MGGLLGGGGGGKGYVGPPLSNYWGVGLAPCLPPPPLALPTPMYDIGRYKLYDTNRRASSYNGNMVYIL